MTQCICCRLIKKDARDLSPLMSRKQRKKMSTDSTSRMRFGQLGQQQQSFTENTTVFFLPGVDVKVSIPLFVLCVRLMLRSA